jgi:MFS family permease
MMERMQSARNGFWAVAFAFLVVMAYAALPTPLYVLYQQRDDFGELLVTVVFAVYAVGVLASLLLVGHVSDWVGRRRVLCAALLLDAASVLAFLLWPALAGLLVGRVVCGVATGMATATATAYLAELRRAALAGPDSAGGGDGVAAAPSAADGRANVVATAANLGGMGLGPLLAGALAQWAPRPLSLPFEVAGLLLLVAAAAVALTPETVHLPRRAWPRWRPQRVVIPRAGRARFAAAAASAMVSFATLSVFSSVGPGFLAATLHHRSHALAGAVTCAIFLAGVGMQIALGRLTAARLAGLGQTLAAVGLAVLVAALWLELLPLYVLAGLLAGAGCGVLFKGCIATVNELAPPDARAEALAGLFVAAYCGTAVPTVALGLATQVLDAKVALLAFALLMWSVIAGPGRRVRRPAAAGVSPA